MNPYEMTFIIRPDRDEDGTRAVAEAVTGRISAAGGEIIAAIPWNPPRRRMAYPIKDFGDGFYVTTVFRVDPSALGPIENSLKLNENILRFLIVQATDLNIKQAQQRLAQQQAAAQAPPPQAPQHAAPVAPEGVAPVVEEVSVAAPTATEGGEADAAPAESSIESTVVENVPEPATAGTTAETQE